MEDFDDFIRKYPMKTYKKGECVLLRGDKPQQLFIIESGLVKTYTITSDGSERVITISQRGEDFPIGFALGIVDVSQYFYEAYSKLVIREMPPGDYLEYLNRNQQAWHMYLARLTTLLLAALDRVNALEQPRAADKIAHTMLYMADRIGVRLRLRPTGQLRVTMTQQDIANSLGLTRETANVGLKKLESLKLIAHTRQNYIIYRERIHKYLNDRSD